MQSLLIIALCLVLSKSQFNNWMSNPIIRNKTLAQITIPGTHDAGSYSVTGKQLTGVPDWLDELDKIANFLGLPIYLIIKDWALAQDKNLYEQLNGGIRYADIRACWYNGTSFYPQSKENLQFMKEDTVGEWRTHHGVVLGSQLQGIFNQVKQFLDENPTEVVILEITHMTWKCPDVDRTSLIQMIHDIFGQYLYPRRDVFDETIQQMIDKNQRLIVLFESNDLSEYPFLWYDNTLDGSYADSPDLTTMETFNKGKIDEFFAHGQYYKGQLYQLSWDLTPTAQTVLQSILIWKPSNLLELADLANKDLDNWFDQNVADYKYPIFGNILVIDHFQSSEIVKVVQRNIQ